MAKNGINIRTGGTVCALRREQGLSQEELAFRAGLDVSTVGRIERGEMSPTLDTLGLLSEALGIDVVLLFRAEIDDDSVKAGARREFELLLNKADVKTIDMILHLLRELLERTPGGEGIGQGGRKRKKNEK